MLETIGGLLEHSPMLALFAAIGLGYALGQISIGGFSLGAGAVLFAGLALGAIAPGSAPPAMVNSIGLVMFLYGIGIQYGGQFFSGLKGPGLKWNLLAAAGVLCAMTSALLLGNAFGVAPAYSMGLFAGSLTSTPTLQAAIDAVGNRDPAIGYSVSYPFGVIGPILCLFAFARFITLRVPPAARPLQHLEITLDSWTGGTVRDLIARLPDGVDLASVRRGDTNSLPEPETPLSTGDTVMLIGLPDVLDQARRQLGRVDHGRITSDRGDLDLVRVFISRPAVVGTPLGQATLPDGTQGRIVEVRRGDNVLFPAPGLMLEYGDRIAVIASRGAFPGIRKHFGDSIKSTAEFSYVSVGLGMSLGVLLGLIQIPLPGIGSFSLGFAGGPLVVALILGRLGRTGPMSWHIPFSANLTLRNFGLTLFLAAVGLGAGAPFAETVSTTGFLFLGIGAAILLGTVLGVMLVGHYLLKLSSDELFGVVAGTTGNPAIFVYANRAIQSDRVDLAYASIYPSMTILKIILVQVAIAFLYQ
jgi:putative transport protein